MRGVEHIPWLYDAFMAVMESFGLDRWRSKLLAGASGRTLEIGCGTGRNLPLYPPGIRVVASEPDLRMLLAARRRASGPLIVATTEALPFHAASFDTVVSSLVFCSVGDPRRGLREIGRVLTSTGCLRMMEHVRHHRRLLGSLQDTVQPAWTWISGGCHPNRDTEATVEGEGFTIARASRRARGAMRLFSASPR